MKVPQVLYFVVLKDKAWLYPLRYTFTNKKEAYSFAKDQEAKMYTFRRDD